MLVAFSTLSGACILFGRCPTWILDHGGGPAATGVLHSTLHTHAVLPSGGPIGAVRVPFEYFKPTEPVTLGATVALGGLLACSYLRIAEPRPIGWLRALHSGSVNDHAATR